MTKYFDLNFNAFEVRISEALDQYPTSALTDWLNRIYDSVQDDTAALMEISLVGDLWNEGQWMTTPEFLNRLGHLLHRQGKKVDFFF